MVNDAIPIPTPSRPSEPSSLRPVQRTVAVVVLILAALFATSCSAEEPVGESGATTIDPSAAAASALLTRLASETASDDERATIERKIAGTDRRSIRLTQQLSRIDEQIDALEAVVAPCRP